jgi:hypothetical protein
MIGSTCKEREKRHEVHRQIGRVLLIKAVFPPIDKYIIFQPAKRCSIFSITLSQIDLALKEAPNGIPRYFKGKEETSHPKIPTKPSTILILPT